MNAKDHFIEWLREKILQNPAEPPPAAWQEIADSLDLEEGWEEIEEELELNTVWEKVDTRLQHYEHLLRFEKISQGLSLAALALLFLPVFYMPAQQEPSLQHLALEQNKVQQEKKQSRSAEAEPIQGITREKEEEVQPDLFSDGSRKAEKHSRSLKSQQQQQQQPDSYDPENTDEEDLREEIFQKQQEAGPNASLLTVADSSYRNIEILRPEWEADTSGLSGVSMEDQQSAAKDPFEAYPSSYIGAGTAIKLSSLLSSKTLHAMERTSLLSSAPSWQQDIYVLYGQRLAKRLLLQADVYLQNKVGQQYNEYREGTYTSFHDVLSYQSVALSASWLRKQLGYGSIPVFVRWTGGIYGGRLLSAEESSGLGTYTRSGEYSRFHAGLLAGYEYDVVLHPQLMLSYGAYGRTDVMNIYSGTALIPSSFRKTKAASIDLRLTIRYTLKK